MNLTPWRRKALTFRTSPPLGGPLDPSQSNPVTPLTTGRLYEAAAPAQAVVGTLARGVARARFRVGIWTPEGLRPTRDGRLELALQDSELIAALTSDLSVYGRAFCAVAGGRDLIRLPADTTEVVTDGLLVTGFKNGGREYGVDEVAYVHHYGASTTTAALGASPLEAVRPELEEYLAAYAEAKDLANGASLVIKRPIEAPELDETGLKRLSMAWRGARRVPGGNPVLDEGMDITLVPRHAGFVEARRLCFDAVCSIYSVPPAMVAAADGDRNLDSAQRTFATDAVQPVGDLLAAAFTRVAVPAFYAENPTASRIVVRCSTEDMTRDRFAQRMTAYRTAVGGTAPIFSVDEVRSMEGFGPEGAPAPEVKAEAPPPAPAPVITVHTPDVHVEPPVVTVNVEGTKAATRRRVKRDDNGRVTEIQDVTS